jgi:hypothetical protein
LRNDSSEKEISKSPEDLKTKARHDQLQRKSQEFPLATWLKNTLPKDSKLKGKE